MVKGEKGLGTGEKLYEEIEWQEANREGREEMVEKWKGKGVCVCVCVQTWIDFCMFEGRWKWANQSSKMVVDFGHKSLLALERFMSSWDCLMNEADEPLLPPVCTIPCVALSAGLNNSTLHRWQLWSHRVPGTWQILKTRWVCGFLTYE